MVKTARIGEKVDGKIIDISVKHAPNHVLAPTWELVMGFKKGRIAWEQYEGQYLQLLRDRYKTKKAEFDELVQMAMQEDIVLICFCVSDSTCHRRLAKGVLDKLIEKQRVCKEDGVHVA
jgi:uncharacterized protein YeaO (DUF488 family)